MPDTTDNVAPEHVFHFKDGKKAHNLHDLKDVIRKMDDDTFNHHVDEDNNDFANWVEFVYKNESLAKDLQKVSDKKRMAEVIESELGEYGGEKPADEPVEDPNELFSGKPSKPPQTLDTHDGKQVHTISTQATHKFIVKEFFWGFIVGLLAGILLIASLLHFGVFPGVL
ncbi:hypothetical protein KY327_02825 [Candidatus Woesearchaeota archaeon]|nr:hypothetical protein [Candidatus Woesearchaeota archaeon]